MQEVGHGLLASAGIAVLIAGCKFEPLRAIQRGVIRLRALGYLLGEMADGAWARRGRWAECEERARREA